MVRPGAIVLTFAAVSFAVGGPAAADPVADFYRGKSISFVIGVGPGGGYDLSGRLVAQHLGRFIPGKPTVVPRNMPGASSIVAALNLFNVLPRDGNAIGLRPATFVVGQISG